ncbi:MAG: hypothetical protein QXP81_01535 [Nitrososphaerota archaeon]
MCPGGVVGVMGEGEKRYRYIYAEGHDWYYVPPLVIDAETLDVYYGCCMTPIIAHHEPARYDPVRKMVVCRCCGEPVYVDGRPMVVDPSSFRNWEDPKVREEVMRMIEEDEEAERREAHHHK